MSCRSGTTAQGAEGDSHLWRRAAGKIPQMPLSVPLPVTQIFATQR
jgi:hypothetical protein